MTRSAPQPVAVPNMRRSFRFPNPLRRAPVSNALPVTRAGTAPTTVRGPLPRAGGSAASVPASRRNIGRDIARPGRSYLTILDDLNTGATPNYIDRRNDTRNAGVIGNDMSGWPYDGNSLPIAHNRIPRTPRTVTPFRKSIDTNVTIPAIGIGSPV